MVVKGIKASATRIQRAAAAVVKTFESEEPVVEAVNVVSAGVSVEQWRNLNVALDTGERWRGYGSELARRYEVSDAVGGRVQVVPVEPVSRSASARSCQQLDAHRFEVQEITASAHEHGL